ncbi:hypothetical protein BOX15_Mlig027348g1 [Macrostomum lignano]|uniref:Autophagy-related protein 9 n=1 Tax=Macrostomum lignano TaxID=282301 RepID=A0A267HAS9_9PLAT|nr:hypothetical protein BOX15_Mlig027348g1 [Macrostomum lignano]
MTSSLFHHGGYQSLDGDTGLGGAAGMPSIDFHEEEIAFSSEETSLDPRDQSHRFEHIQNLDDFFTRVYRYHQRGGFVCMALEELFQLFQLAFVVIFSTFLMECVNYTVLFRNAMTNGTKTRLSEAVINPQYCAAHLSGWVVFAVIVSIFVWLAKFAKVSYNLIKYWETRGFYTQALKICDSSELASLTWAEVQSKLLAMQKEYHLCVHKSDLTELDIYNRILRFENYTVAMVNKDLLPLKLQLPFIGENVYFSRWLKYNIKLALFYFPYWGLFENRWHLKPEYKRLDNRSELVERLRKIFRIFGLLNILLLPLIFLWQILLLFFKYAELVKREPSLLGSRRWSEYGRVYLRHFNELDHELEARLVRAYEPAARYMNCFTSRVLTVLAKNVMFFAGALLVVLIVLSVIDEDVLHVEHVLTGMTVLGIVVTICRASIPDENQVWCPELLLKKTLCHIHYLPDSWQWRGREHKTVTRNNFSVLFQYKVTFLLEEMLSPIVTPLMLLFVFPDRCGQLIDFFRNFTIDIQGVGDVCSFAQLDVRAHGNPEWSADADAPMPTMSGSAAAATSTSSVPHDDQPAELAPKAADGKTELSLLHFHLTNPGWQPHNRQSGLYLDSLRRQAMQASCSVQQLQSQQQQQQQNLLLAASFPKPEDSTTGALLMLQSQQIFAAPPNSLEAAASAGAAQPMSLQPQQQRLVGGVCRLDHHQGQSAQSLQHQQQQQQSMVGMTASAALLDPYSVAANSGQQSLAAQMSVSTLYLHELHHHRLLSRAPGAALLLAPMAEDEPDREGGGGGGQYGGSAGTA